MAYRKIFLTINAETGKQVDAANMEIVRSQERPQMYVDEYIVLCMTYLNSDGTAHTGFGASDTWRMGADNDYTHYNALEGTLLDNESGAQTTIRVSYATDPTTTLGTEGHIWPVNAAGSTERVAYTAVSVTGSGPYTATLTVSHTLANAYLIGETVKLEDGLLAWADNAAFNTGEWSAEDVTNGKISCRFACNGAPLSTAIGTSETLAATCEITRFETGTGNPSVPGQFAITFRNIVVDSEGNPVVQDNYWAQTDARYIRQTDAFAAAATELTIATGSITRTQWMHKVDTESDAASDDLDTIATATEGDFIRLYLANAARVVTLKHGTGNIATSSGNDIVMGSGAVYDLYFDGSNWVINDYLISGVPSSVEDNNFSIVDDGDATKILKFQCSGITTGNTRTVTMVDADIVIAGSASALTSGRIPYVTTGGLLLDTSTLVFDGTNVGIGTTGPDAKLDVLATTEQLRLTYTDGAVYTSFTTDSAGDLTITPSGGNIKTTDVGFELDISGGFVPAIVIDATVGTGTNDGYIVFAAAGVDKCRIGLDVSTDDFVICRTSSVPDSLNAAISISNTDEVQLVTHAAANVTMFELAASGETPALEISGYRTGDAKRTLSIAVGASAANQVDFSGLSTYDFAGTVNATTSLTVGATDSLTLSHDGTDAYFKTDDGSFIFLTDEGTNTITNVDVKGKGTQYGAVRIYDQDEAEWLQLSSIGSIGYVNTAGASPGRLYLQAQAYADVECFQATTEGVTRYFEIYGYRPADAKRSLQIAVGASAADTASFDGVSNYRFDGTVNAITAYQVNGTQVVGSQQTALTATLTTVTHTAPGTPDYAIADLTNSGPFGFTTKDEGNTVLSVIANLQTRVDELETKLQAHGLVA